MPPIKLYTYWRSSSSYRVRIALAWKQIAYESVAVNLLAAEQSRETYKERSPSGFVPCLEVGGRACSESVAIVELLEDLVPEPALLPKDPWARARVRTLVELVNAGTQPFGNLSVLRHVSNDKAAQMAWVHHFFGKGFAALEGQMAANASEGVVGRYAFGDAVTAADVFVVPAVFAARRFGTDLVPYPRVIAAADAALALPAFDASRPDRQPDAVPNAP